MRPSEREDRPAVPPVSATIREQLRTAALIGTLVPLGLAVASGESVAGAAAPDPNRSSHVEGSVTPGLGVDGDQFLYAFEVFNTSPSGSGGFAVPEIVNWELPLFSLNGIAIDSITSPFGWDFEIVDFDGNVVIDTTGADVAGTGRTSLYYNNEFGPYGDYKWDWTPGADPVLTANPGIYGPDEDIFLEPDFILHWFTCESDILGAEGAGCEGLEIGVESPINPIAPGNSLEGFSFLAADSDTNVPYEASWFFQPPTIGDPPSPDDTGGLPGIPANFQATAVPAPGSLVLLVGGLLGLIGLRRRIHA